MSRNHNKFECKRCGWCCENIVINVSYSDIIGWYKKRRWDILHEVAWINNYPKKNTGGFYITKTVLNPKMPCPFLKKEEGIACCLIENIKPKSCKDYPLGSPKGCNFFKKVTAKNVAKVKNSQYGDFRKAFDERIFLTRILASAREIIKNG